MRLGGAAVLALCALLAGCALNGVTLPGLCDGSSLLREAAGYEALSDEGAERELARLRQLVERRGSDCDRLRLALFAAAQPARRADAQALRGLDEFLEGRRGRSDALTELARLLGRTLRERTEGDARARAAAKKVAEEQGRADACKRQLDDLRNVEKLLHERETR